MESYSHAPVPVSFQYWMKSADDSLSTDGYVKDAVHLSWLLTKHLMQLISASKIMLPDIAVDNVILFVDRASAIQPSPSSRLAIKAVQFQAEMMPQLLLSPRNALCASPMLSPRAVCAALGNILLEIFSKGKSSSPGTFDGTYNTLNFTENNQPETMPAAQRRNVPSISVMVNSLLLEVGMPMSVRRLVCDLLDAINEPCPDSALSSLDEVLWDLTQMKSDPTHHLFDRTCPQTALEDTRDLVSTMIDTL